jgi:hypothetical protein
MSSEIQDHTERDEWTPGDGKNNFCGVVMLREVKIGFQKKTPCYFRQEDLLLLESISPLAAKSSVTQQIP